MHTVSKLTKQNKQTWVKLQRRLNSAQFPHSKLFTNDKVHSFVTNKAISVGSPEGYFIPTLLTTTAFILAWNDTRVDSSTHKQPLNLFYNRKIICDTARSSGFLEAEDLSTAVISRTTSSWLVSSGPEQENHLIISRGV